MDDRQIQRLVRMALEAQALESGEGASDRLLLSAHRSRRLPGFRWMAAAASVALVAGVWFVLRSPSSSGSLSAPGTQIAAVRPPSHPVPGPVKHEPTKPEVAMAPHKGLRSVLLTIFRDSYGDLSCVRWRPHEWGEGKTLAEVTPSELIDAGAMGWCDGTASEMVVVALSGPADSVPVTDLLAFDLAECISGSSDLCEQEPGTYASVTLSCLPPGVQARAQSIPLGLQ